MKTPNLLNSRKRKQPHAWEEAKRFFAAKNAKAAEGLDRWGVLMIPQFAPSMPTPFID